VRAEFVERMAAVAQVTIVDRLVGGASSNWR
jgi:hypothetical protein